MALRLHGEEGGAPVARLVPLEAVPASSHSVGSPLPLVEPSAVSFEAEPSPDTPRVLVVDSNLLTAEAIALALTQMMFVTRFVVPVTTGHLRDVVTWNPGLALLDIDTVEYPTCLDCVTILHGAGVPVAIMAGKRDPYLLGECVDAGASCVVDKGSPMVKLLGDIVRLLQGEVLLGDEAKRQYTGPYLEESRARKARLAPFNVLTQREKCVLAELMDGHSAEVIARRASVSTSTVRSQIKAILQKLGVNSQLAAAALAAQAGWSLDASAVVSSRSRALER